MSDSSIAKFAGSIDDEGSCYVIVFDPSEDECVVVFNHLTIDVPVMEIVQSGIKMAVKCFHVGIVLVVTGLHPLYLCSIFLASLCVMSEMCANVPVDICPDPWG